MIGDPRSAPIDAVRARTFGSAAAAYDEFRPGYPDAAVDRALAGTGSRVLDLGAGTGKLTASLVERGLDVVVVEPDPQMLARLRERLPGVDAREGLAEQVPLPDGAVDAVVVGQAAHRFDPDRAGPEIARVLRPGGVLAGLWNADDHDVDWVRGAAEAAAAGQPVAPNPRGPSTGAVLPGEPWFTSGERTEVPWLLPRTTESFLANLRTHSWALTSELGRREAAIERVRAYLDRHPDTARGEFAVPMVTLVWRAHRLDPPP